jgi:hypothetical protein
MVLSPTQILVKSNDFTNDKSKNFGYFQTANVFPAKDDRSFKNFNVVYPSYSVTRVQEKIVILTWILRKCGESQVVLEKGSMELNFYYVCKEVMSRLHVGKAYYHSVQVILSFNLLSEV